MNNDQNKNLPLSGAGGGKGGGGSPSEVKDNQFSDVIARVLIAYSSGETDGLLDGTNSIFLDGTQLSGNFTGVKYAERQGSIGQSYLKGFEQATSVKNVGVVLENGTPVTRTVTDGDVDSVRVIITLPSFQDVESDGDIKGTSVDLKFEVRDPSSGLWEERATPTITGKSSGPFQRQFTIGGPDVITGAWDWRVTRLTPDSTSSRLSNDTTVQSAVEIRLGKETYDGTAYIGLEFDTADFGNSIPAITAQVSGVRVKVPSNYSEVNRIPVYSGIWDGTWKYASTENPTWHIYNLLTNNEIGLGLPESYVDRYNFYEAARYNDAVNDLGAFVGVPDGNGGFRRRFTINTQITGQKEGLEILQDMASSMRAVLYFGAGAIVLKQDQPRSVSRIITNENVENGTFFYSSTPARDRITVAKVGYNDPDDFFNIKYARYPEESEWSTDPNIARFGRNEVEVTKFGCTSEAEAQTFAQWIVYSSCNESRTVTFTGSLECMLLRPGDVIEVSDRRLAGAARFDQRFGGRIAGGDFTSVVLDYPVELKSGESYSITIIDADGESMETRDITTPAGVDISSITVDSTFTNIPTKGYTWLIQGTDIVPQKFSIIHTERKEGLKVEVFALQYDDQKFAAVEQNVPLVQKPYSRINVRNIEPPTNARFQLIPRFDDAKGILNTLLVQWDASVSEYATRYIVRFRKDNGPWRDGDLSDFNEFEIENITKGKYDVLIYAQSPLGYQSPPLFDSYTVEYGTSQIVWDGQVLTIEPPVITSNTTFEGKDLVVEWNRNSANDIPGIVFKEYVVEFSVGGTLQRTVITTDTKATYYYDDMIADQGTPSRTIDVKVRERDTFLHESLNATQTFNNPVPLAPNFTLKPNFTLASIEISPLEEKDVAGYYLFRSKTSGFTPSVSNVVHKGVDTSIIDNELDEGTLYYYKVAAYDLFGDDINTLNISAQNSTTTIVLDTDITEYEFQGISFSLSGNTVSWTGGTVYARKGDTFTTTTVTSGSDLWISGTLYVYFSDISGTIESGTNLGQIYSGGEAIRVLASYDGSTLKQGINEPIIDGANILAETIGATQLVTSNLITNTAQINDAIITNAKVSDLSADKITTGSIQAGQTITAQGIIKSTGGNSEAGVGPITYNFDEYILWGLDLTDISSNQMRFGIGSNGDAFVGNKDNGNYLEYSNGVLQLGPETSIGSNQNKSYTVGTGGNFTTLNDALIFISKTIPSYTKGGFTAEIKLLSGYVMQEQVIVSDIDLSWVTIDAQDANITVDGNFLTYFAGGVRPAFAAIDGGKTPKLDNLNITLINASSLRTGFLSDGVGSVLYATNIGADSFEYGFFIDKGGKVNATSTLSASNNVDNGFDISDSSELAAFSVTSTNNGNYGIILKDSSRINTVSGITSSSNTDYNLLCWSSSIVCNNLTINNSTTGGGMQVERSSNISCFELFSSGNKEPISVQNASTISVSFDMEVENDATNPTFSGDVRVSAGSRISCGGRLNCYPHNLFLTVGSIVNRQAASTGGSNITPNQVNQFGAGILFET